MEKHPQATKLPNHHPQAFAIERNVEKKKKKTTMPRADMQRKAPAATFAPTEYVRI
jgi:hypothetical protein